jgi:tetratricopeptide (TPR) repeat protein
MTDPLLAEAAQLLQSGEPDEALAIALRLSEGGEPEALALVAQVLGERGERERLIEVAESFSDAHPKLARGWELLGDALSLAGQKASALQAYGRAATCADADPGRLACSKASALIQAGAHSDARAALDAVPEDSPYLVRGAMLRLQSCNATGEHQQGLDFVAQALTGKVLTAPPAELAWLMVEEGHARLATDQNQQAALCGVRAAALDRGNEGALYVLREALGMRSPDAHRYRIQLEADLVEEAGGGRFTAAYEVVADEPGEALALCQPLEPGATDFTITAFDKGEPTPELPKGVYSRGAREAIR